MGTSLVHKQVISCLYKQAKFSGIQFQHFSMSPISFKVTLIELLHMIIINDVVLSNSIQAVVLNISNLLLE